MGEKRDIQYTQCLTCSPTMLARSSFMQHTQGGANLEYVKKRGGEVVRSCRAAAGGWVYLEIQGGARITQGGGRMPPRPPLNTHQVTHTRTHTHAHTHTHTRRCTVETFLKRMPCGMFHQKNTSSTGLHQTTDAALGAKQPVDLGLSHESHVIYRSIYTHISIH